MQQSSVVSDSTFNIVTENFLSFRFTVTIPYRLKWSFPPIFFRYYILIDWLKVQQSNDNLQICLPKEVINLNTGVLSGQVCGFHFPTVVVHLFVWN